jgi:hypothetical protein
MNALLPFLHMVCFSVMNCMLTIVAFSLKPGIIKSEKTPVDGLQRYKHAITRFNRNS